MHGQRLLSHCPHNTAAHRRRPVCRSQPADPRAGPHISGGATPARAEGPGGVDGDVCSGRWHAHPQARGHGAAPRPREGRWRMAAAAHSQRAPLVRRLPPCRCRHDCEETWLILRGTGVAAIQGKDGRVVEAPLAPNSTFTALPQRSPPGVCGRPVALPAVWLGARAHVASIEPGREASAGRCACPCSAGAQHRLRGPAGRDRGQQPALQGEAVGQAGRLACAVWGWQPARGPRALVLLALAHALLCVLPAHVPASPAAVPVQELGGALRGRPASLPHALGRRLPQPRARQLGAPGAKGGCWERRRRRRAVGRRIWVQCAAPGQPFFAPMTKQNHSAETTQSAAPFGWPLE